ncbi:MAG TPA: carbamoyltransferase N-terminal domain-containing protein [Bacteroidia bacterium]|nr:carbamoyltransferase N-terminal domain-containing protein [Bacteroidia bacterium]
MNILGFNCYGHDSAAALMVDDEVVFAVEEERLNRKKHYGGIPEASIRAALEHANLTLADIDHVAFFWKPSISYSKVPVFLLKFWNKVPQLLREQRSFSVEENLGMLNYLKDMKRLPGTLKKLFPSEREAKFRFHLLEHHFCHAASAFFPTPYDDAAILTIDGAGEWTTSMFAHGKGNDIRRIGGVNTPYSLGAFYQAISRHLGFRLIEGPGKLMGLASYGKADTDVYRKMRSLVKLTGDGGFRLDLSYFCYHYTRKTGVTKKFTDLFGASKSEGKDWSGHELDVAAAAQHIVEDVILHMVRTLKKNTGSENLCMAGGVALNSVTNGLIAKEGLFKNIFIQPAAGDSGTALGAALMLNHGVLKRERKWIMETAFLGPGYATEDYEAALKKSGLPYVRTDDYCAFAARQLAKNKILGWFQGRMEFGPRALGNRSIITSPLGENTKAVVNARVKFREPFRPFAAIVLEEDCGKYFDSSFPNPYMLFVYNVRPEYLGKMPAITHVDNSVRIQTVNATENPEMRKLLEAFKKETGYSVLLNTSFNIKGEPIVASPEDAVHSFERADMDYLIIGDFIVGKKGDEGSLREV